MTNRQTLPELLARITADRHAAELESLNRVIAEERARADRCRDEAVSLRDMLDDVIESLELLASVPGEPQPIPTDAEDVDARTLDGLASNLPGDLCALYGQGRPLGGLILTLTQRCQQVKSQSIPVAELAEVLGCDADAASVRMRLEDMTSEEDGPQPDANGWYEHDGRSWPVCLPSDEVEFEDQDGDRMVRKADLVLWVKQDFRPVRWRYADGRDTGGGAS